MRRRKSKTQSTEVEANFEIDLSPMLALMVCLIPIMLLATVFVRVTIIESPLPQAVQNAIEEDRNKKDREVEFSVRMENDKSLKVEVKQEGKVISEMAIPAVGSEWDFAKLNSTLVGLKQNHPTIFRLSLFPAEEVPYNEIVKFMDEVRMAREGSPKFFVNDEKTNQKVETNILFPDVIFGNVLEG